MLGSSDIVGMDIGQFSIKLAKVKKHAKSFVSQLIAYQIIPEELRSANQSEALKTLVGNLLKQHKLTKATLVLHVAAADVIMREVNIPAALTGDALEGAIELDLGPALPFSMDEVYFDYEEKPDKEGNHLAVVVRREIADAKTQLVQVGKQKTAVRVDVDLFAYEHLVEQMTHSGDIAESCVMLVDIGYEKSHIHVFDQGKYVFTREQQIGGKQATDMIQEAKDIDSETAENQKLTRQVGADYATSILEPYSVSLAEQINLAMDFYEASETKQHAVEHIYFVGGGARLSGLMTALQGKIEVPFSLLDLSKRIAKAADNETGVDYALAIGLAMEAK